jgi:murein DD-endopeptidase MepM/ murein hydrolase activator NlpD
MGTTVVVRHEGGYTTKYASLDAEVSVKAGDTVTAGQAIGKVGSSALLESGIGDHVHFSVSCDGVLVDPAEFLK